MLMFSLLASVLFGVSCSGVRHTRIFLFVIRGLLNCGAWPTGATTWCAWYVGSIRGEASCVFAQSEQIGIRLATLRNLKIAPTVETLVVSRVLLESFATMTYFQNFDRYFSRGPYLRRGPSSRTLFER